MSDRPLDDIFVSYPEIPKHTGGLTYSRKHLIDLIRLGKFPNAYQISANRIAWKSSELKAWAQSRPKGRLAAVADATTDKPPKPPAVPADERVQSIVRRWQALRASKRVGDRQGKAVEVQAEADAVD